MKIAFFSAYLNHHQLPLALAFDKLTDHQYVYVATREISQARLALGYKSFNNSYPFVVRSYESKESYEQAMEIAKTCDVMIHGSANGEFLTERLKTGKLTFRYSERLYKEKMNRHNFEERARWGIDTFAMSSANPHYMLCSSAFTARDNALFGNYIGRSFKWGYFPEVKIYDSVDSLMQMKTQNEKLQILWVARLLSWKHPETAVKAAAFLKDRNTDFDMNLIGIGELQTEVQNMIAELKLEDCVHMLGAFSQEKVREYMERADIFLFTSDRNEGWGAVLNESMNSGCAVVASSAIGSVPYLIKNNVNGIIYRDGNQNSLNAAVLELANNAEKRRIMGENAYKTMRDTWNADTAADRFLQLCDCLQQKNPTPFKDGPCSKAHIINPGR